MPRREATIHAHEHERRAWLNAYKVERGCCDCGYNADPIALAFDHRDPTVKLFMLSETYRIAKMRWERVLEEVAKCDVRCHNCHAIRTRTQWAPPKRDGQLRLDLGA